LTLKKIFLDSYLFEEFGSELLDSFDVGHFTLWRMEYGRESLRTILP